MSCIVSFVGAGLFLVFVVCVNEFVCSTGYRVGIVIYGLTVHFDGTVKVYA